MDGERNGSRSLLAAALIGLGILGLAYGDFALQWQPVPQWVPGRAYLACASALLLVMMGAGLLWPRARDLSSRVLLGYTVLWFVLLKIPRLVAAPGVELSWNGAGEIAVIVSAALVLAASAGAPSGETGARIAAAGPRVARFVFSVAVIPIGLSHFTYLHATAGLVPAWLPYRVGWAALCGAAHIAAGLGVLFGVLSWLAARLEAAMIGAFTVLVWLPRVLAEPGRLNWTAMLVSATIAAAAWVVGESLRWTGVPAAEAGATASVAPEVTVR